MKTHFNRYFHLMAKPSSFHCNIKCEYCFYLEKEKIFPQAAGSKKNQYMSDTVLDAYIRQYIAKNHSPQVNFAWQGGEPTLLGLDFYRKAVRLQQQYADGKIITNSFQTNGIMLNRQWCEFFRDHQFLIGISVDGLASVHDSYRVFNNGTPTFARIRKAVNLLLEHQVEFNTLTVVNDKNWDKGRETYTALKELGAQFMQFIPIVEPTVSAASDSDKAVTGFSVPAHGYGQFLSDIFMHWVYHDVGKIFINEFDSLLAQWLGYPSGSCIHAEYCGDAMIVEANGDLYACDHFVDPERKIGNIVTDDLAACVQSEAQYRFGTDKKTTLTSLCLQCDVLNLCHGGCPKDRLIPLPGETYKHNYLCASYKNFYHRSAPFMREMSQIIRTGGIAADIMPLLQTAAFPANPPASSCSI